MTWNDEWKDWIRSHKSSNPLRVLDQGEGDGAGWYCKLLEIVKEEIIHYYGQSCRDIRIDFNMYLKSEIIKYIEDNYEDIINDPFNREPHWTKLGSSRFSPIEDMEDLLMLQRFIMTQYDNLSLIRDSDSPYWDETGQFLLVILSDKFIRDLVDLLSPRLSEEESGITYKLDNFVWVRTCGLKETALYICQEDLDDLESIYDDLLQSDNLDGIKPITKLQAICRGWNTRWRYPLHLLTIS